MAIKKFTLNTLNEMIAQNDARYAMKDDFDTLQSTVSTLEANGGEENVIESVQVNGTALTVSSKAVNIPITTGTSNGTISVNGSNVAVYGLASLAYKSSVSTSELSSALLSLINGKADAATTLAGYGITDGMTATEIASAISSAVAAADHLKRVTVASTSAIDLTADDADQYIYMVTNSDAESGNLYDEYMVINGALEKVGDWEVDLSDYLTYDSLSTTSTGSGNVVAEVSYNPTTGQIISTKITALQESDFEEFTADEVAAAYASA